MPFSWQLFFLCARHLAAAGRQISLLVLIIIMLFFFSQLFLHALPTKSTLALSGKYFGLSCLLSPIWTTAFFRLYFSYFPFPAELLDLIFRERWKILPLVALGYFAITFLSLRQLFSTRIIWQLIGISGLFFMLSHFSFPLFQLIVHWLPDQKHILLGGMLSFQLVKNLLAVSQFLLIRVILARFIPIRPSSTTAFQFGLILLVVVSYFMLTTHQIRKTFQTEANESLTISHRGVTQKNGVQNTVPALIKTSQAAKPDLVELDVQETADHQLVVIHDPTLKKLARLNRRVDELTWSELKQIPLTENHQQAQLSLFSTYLKQANKLNQSLLIELKVTSRTKDSLSKLFCARYSAKQLAPHQLQSMDLQTTENLKNKYPTLKVGYILPFDLLGAPRTTADFLNIERKTATKELIAHLQRTKQVYLWSVNTQTQAAYFRTLHVAGLLTDDLTVLKQRPVTNKEKAIFYFNP